MGSTMCKRSCEMPSSFSIFFGSRVHGKHERHVLGVVDDFVHQLLGELGGFIHVRGTVQRHHEVALFFEPQLVPNGGFDEAWAVGQSVSIMQFPTKKIWSSWKPDAFKVVLATSEVVKK